MSGKKVVDQTQCFHQFKRQSTLSRSQSCACGVIDAQPALGQEGSHMWTMRAISRTLGLAVPLLFFSLLFFSLPGSLLAQSIVGGVAGVVTDPAGAIVPNATVNLINEGTNDSHTTSTHHAGEYSFNALPPGSYQVTVDVKGFERSVTKAVAVNPGATVRIDVQLRLASAQEQVTITAGQERLQTDSGVVRSVIDEKQLETLPVPAGRNYESLLLLVPGVTPPVNAQSVSANPSRGLQFNTNGAMSNTNNIRIDGATANNVWLPHVAAYNPGLEAIDSVTVTTNAFDAQLGLAGGASVNVHIKTGTNKIHGSTYWYHSDNALLAKPFFLPTGFTRNNKNVDNSVGATIGGPVRRDRLFYFFSYDGHFDAQVSPLFATVPTTALENGDFSGSPNPIYEPGTGNTTNGRDKTPFPNNFIPLNLRDPIALQIQSHLPAANLPGTSNNYYTTGQYHLATNKYDTNITSQLTSKLHLGARMGVLVFSDYDAPVFGTFGLPVSSAGGRQGTSFGNTLNGTGSASYIAAPNFVLDGYFGLTQINTNSVPVGSDQNVGQNLGIPGTNGPTSDYGGWPYFSISNGFSPVGNNQGAIHYADREYQTQVAATWGHTSHSVRFGANVNRQIISHFECGTAGTCAGVFSFSGAGTVTGGTTRPNGSVVAGAPANFYNSYADFLLGLFSSGTSEALPDNNRLVGQTWIYSAFGQDQWLVSRNLTLNYGLRWDYFPIGGRQNRGFERYNFTNNTVEICGVAGNPHNCGYDPSKLNFSPNAGFALRLSQTSVLRAGAGINLDPYPLTYARDLITNFPEDLTSTLSAPNSVVAPFKLEQGLARVSAFDTSSGSVAVPNSYTVRTLPTHPRRSYVETWNVALEKILPGDISTSVRYVGLRQLQISSILNLNSSDPGQGQAGEPYFKLFGRTAATNLLTPVGRNQYDGLQAQLLKRFTKNYSINIGYTWSKAFAYCCDNIAGETLQIQAPGFLTNGNSYLNLNRALAPFDRTYVLTISGNALSPFGKNQKLLTHGIGGALLGGWQLNGIFAAYSGTPITITASSTSLNAPGSIQIADKIKPGRCTLGPYQAGAPYIDPTCFTSVTTARFGTAGFDSVRGPGVKNLNASLFRRFAIGETKFLEFRGEAFNVTNTPHFSSPSSQLNISNVSFNPAGQVKNLNGFGVITGTNSRDQEGLDQRQFRVGAKFIF